MTYNALCNTYVYLRSIKNLLDRSTTRWTKIEEKLKYVLSEEGFGNETKIKELIKELEIKDVGPEKTYAERKVEMGIYPKKYPKTAEEKKAEEYMKEGARTSRAKNWQYRVEQAVKEKVKNGWYPLFATYTVDEKRLPENCLTRDELWTKTPAWDRFVKKFKTEIAEECGYGRRPAKWPRGETFLQYFGVLEHGASGEHPHIHVIWLCKEIPATWRMDPNTNCTDNTRRDIAPASALWEHGQQRMTMGLFMTGSWFTDNWHRPNKIIDGKLTNTKIGDAGAVAGYISKYMTKGETKWKHRVKATKGIGLQSLIRQLKETKSISMLLAMSKRPMEYSVWMKIQHQTCIPLALLRQKSKQEYLKQLHSLNTQRARRFLWKEWTKKPPEFYTNLMLSVRDGAKPWKMMPSQRYKAYTQILEEVAYTVHCDSKVLDIITWLQYNQPRQSRCNPFVSLKGTTI